MAKTRSPYEQYSSVAKTLHWLIAICIIAMLIIGWTMINMSKENPYRFGLFQFHKSLGITILLLSLLRLAWRLYFPAPPYPDTMAGWEKLTARVTHFMFYVLIIGMPLTGWIIVSTASFNLPTLLYGYIPWPQIPVVSTLENKKDIHEFSMETHELAAYILAALLILHVGAALKHHFIDRDNILLRMAPAPLARFLNFLRGM